MGGPQTEYTEVLGTRTQPKKIKTKKIRTGKIGTNIHEKETTWKEYFSNRYAEIYVVCLLVIVIFKNVMA